MLLEATSLLPLDVWLVLLDYIELRDFPNLFCTNTSIKCLIDQEIVYERRARDLYPSALLDISKYKQQQCNNESNNNIHNSNYTDDDDDDDDDINEERSTTARTTNSCGCWKSLLRNRNSENGVYIRRFQKKYSTWRNNNSLRFYVSSIKAMIWDPKYHQILITIEAFGHHDLRPADSSLISYVNSHSKLEIPLKAKYAEAWTYRPGYVLVPMLRMQLPPPRQHDLCQLVFNEDEFINLSNNNNNNDEGNNSNSSGCKTKNTFIFTYSGNMNQWGQRGIRSDDYSSVVFVEHEEEDVERSGKNNNILSNIFDLRHNDDGDCEFIPRDDVNRYMLPSNILGEEWDGIELSDNIRNLHTQKRWGNISQRLLHPTIRATATTNTTANAVVAAENNNNNNHHHLQNHSRRNDYEELP